MSDRLEARHADLAYPGREVARSLSLRIPEGRVTVLVGPNGSGKSTVLRALARLLRPAAGTVLLDGEDLHGLAPDAAARRLSMLAQSPQAPEGLTVRELVAFGRVPHRGWFGAGDPGGAAAVDRALEAVGLAADADRPARDLSGGQRQRAWIALALAQDTPTVLLDEPTTFLDLAHQLDVVDLMRRLNRDLKKTIVAVLHDLNLAARVADRIVALRDGKIAAEGPPAEVITPELLRAVFGVEARIVRDESGAFLGCVPLRPA